MAGEGVGEGDKEERAESDAWPVMILEGAVKNVCFDIHIFFVGSAIAGPSPIHR